MFSGRTDTKPGRSIEFSTVGPTSASLKINRTHKGMVRSDMSKPALIFFSLQEYTQQNPLSKF
jgi:hypothetical protein